MKLVSICLSADRTMQAYAYRMTVTTDPANMLQPWPKPEGYDPAQFGLALAAIKARNISSFRELMGTGGLLPCSPVPPAVSCNSSKGDDNNHAFGQFIGLSWPYPAAVAAGDWEAQEAVWAAHRTAQLGLAYFLSTDESVPLSIRSSSSQLGLPLDEHLACGHFPCQLYVREALRLQGDFIFTQQHIMGAEQLPDSVGRGSYSVDTMHSSLYLAEDGQTLAAEGGMQAPSFLNASIPPFQIPYRAFLPKAAEACNLLVPVALSSSHVGFNAVRLEPTWMTLGESAGVAAAMAAAQQLPVQQLDVGKLQARLWQLGQVL